MLHEILLSLSGHPSALFDVAEDKEHVISTAHALLSPPEAQLLLSLARLSRLHRQIRDHVTRLSATHPSIICRAVASAIVSHHLDNFQRKVLDVESRILKQDASIVGAYNIVPLAGVVNEFIEWTQLMEWLWDIGRFILSPRLPGQGPTEVGVSQCNSGAELIDRLRTEAQTGYPDIEKAALHLGQVAETSWLRQLSTWLLYGRLPSFGASDFFISHNGDDDMTFVVEHRLLPKFVTRQSASSILFIGKSLNQIRALNTSSNVPASHSYKLSELELLPEQVAHLSAVSAPISSAKLSEAIHQIRISLSKNLLQHLLPLERIIETLDVLRQFFLLGRGEFAIALITEADQRLHSRHRIPSNSKASQGIQGILLKETEVNNVLARSFSLLSSLTNEEYHADDILDLATSILHLTLHSPTSHRPGTPGRARESTSVLPVLSSVVFNDLLLSVPVSLTMDIRTPLDLFMTKLDLEVYSSINAYLFALHRAHIHLGQLWRQSSIRREHPPPPGYQYSNTAHGKHILQRRRDRLNSRSREMRKVWATCGAAVFLLAESEAYFQGEVVQESFTHFFKWLAGPEDPNSTTDIFRQSTASVVSNCTGNGRNKRAYDPETLAVAHRQLLQSISYSLLLIDTTFTRAIRDFFVHVDDLVAFVTRLQTIRQHLDLEEDDGVEDFTVNYKQEEKEVARELDRARRRLDSDMKSVITRLRDIDAERVGSVEGLNSSGDEAGYQPLRVGGIDRLLMKLDWGAGRDGEDGIE